jgi:hypothetical protein
MTGEKGRFPRTLGPLRRGHGLAMTRTPQLVGAECEPKSALVCGFGRGCLQAGTMDSKIAAIVVSRDATLLSRNLADLRQVPGLQVEDWTG